MTTTSARTRMGPAPRFAVLAVLLAALGGCAAPAATPLAVFDVRDLVVSVDRAEILAGDEVEVTARIENTGTLAGTYRAELTVDGATAARQDVALDPGEVETARFVVEAGPPGNHEIGLGPVVATMHVTSAPAYRVTDLRLAGPRQDILAGDALVFEASVTNDGTKSGTYDAALTVDGVVAARQSVAVGPGQSTTVRFPVTAGPPGTHTAQIADENASYTVLDPASLTVTDLRLGAPGVSTGDTVDAVVTVVNRGGAIGMLTVAVTVDGKVVATRDATIAGGEELALQFAFDAPRAGRHVVAAGPLEQELVVWKITRPSNGTVFVNKVKGGDGHLIIKNGDRDLDTVVVLASSSSPTKSRLAVYVRAGRSATIKGIKDGRYIAYFTFGERWDSQSKAFTASQELRRFDETVRFRTTRTSTAIRYSIITLSLHKSGGSSVPTEAVGDEDFPSVP